MNCNHCGNAAPEDLRCISKIWICLECVAPVSASEYVRSYTVIESIMDTPPKEGLVKYLYISEFTNNLAKVHQMLKQMNLFSKTVTLILPEALHTVLDNEYDVIYIDAGIVEEVEQVIFALPISESGYLAVVNPTTMELVDEYNL